MNWRRTLQSKTRQPKFLWRMVLGIIAAGLVVGFLVQYLPGLPVGQQLEVPTDMSLLKSMEQAATQGRWADLWWAIPRWELHRLNRPGPIVLALLTGGCWLVFILQALQLDGEFNRRLSLALVAVLLGVLSIWPTVFFIFWQEHAWGLRDSSSLLPGLRFYVMGVGLREEFSKLVCLLPLLPLLLRMRSELAAFLISGCVGLDFALAENAGKFSGTGGTDVLGRYLTANPMHLTLTGLMGLAAYRGLRYPRDWGPQALATFLLIVFAHGLYDAFIAVPALAEYSLLGTIVFALVVFQFFRELRQARARRPDTVSLTANFLCGVSLVTAATFVYLSAVIGWSTAFDVLVEGVLGLAVMVYLFLREMPETMVSV